MSLQYEIIDKDRFAIELLCPCGLPEVFGDMMACVPSQVLCISI